jgi:hypothetical protein
MFSASETPLAPALAALAFIALVLCAFPAPARANVVAPAPEFAWINAAGKAESASKFRNQPVVVLIAPSPRSWSFRSQVGQLQRVYQRLGATGAVAVAAFTKEGGTIRSNIPFAIATDGPRVAALFGIERGFAIAVLGKDGNIDALSTSVLSGQRILDIIGNSFVVQTALRRP